LKQVHLASLLLCTFGQSFDQYSNSRNHGGMGMERSGYCFFLER